MTAVELPEDFLQIYKGFSAKHLFYLLGRDSHVVMACRMGALAEHLANNVYGALATDSARNAWTQSINAIKENLETGLNNIPLGMAGWDEILSAIRGETAKLILDKAIAAEAQILVEK
jgi:3-hydroxyacyl-CoA dehydrogenase